VQYRPTYQLYGHIIGIYRRSGERWGRKVGGAGNGRGERKGEEAKVK